MNKKEAAEFLECSERAINRYLAKGQLSRKYVRGKNGKEAFIDEEELRRFKEEHAETYEAQPAIVRDDTPDPLAIDTIDTRTPDRADRLEAAMTAIAETQRSMVLLLPAPSDGKPAPAVPVSERLTLTLDEASSLSGLSRVYLREAIKGKKLKAAIRGRGWNIKRADLEAFIKKL